MNWFSFWLARHGYPRPLDPRQPEGFREPVMFYLAWCRVHRQYYEDYGHGFVPHEYLRCPDCLAEKSRKVVESAQDVARRWGIQNKAKHVRLTARNVGMRDLLSTLLLAVLAVTPIAMALKLSTFLGFWAYMPFLPNILDYTLLASVGAYLLYSLAVRVNGWFMNVAEVPKVR